MIGFPPTINLGNDVGNEKGDRIRENTYRDLESVKAERTPSEEFLKNEITRNKRGDENTGENEIEEIGLSLFYRGELHSRKLPTSASTSTTEASATESSETSTSKAASTRETATSAAERTIGARMTSVQ